MLSLIPMAGRGSRFRHEGYGLPKPFIPIRKQPMFLAAIRSFAPADRYILICLEEFVQKYSFKARVEQELEHCTVMAIDGVTLGQACTCLLAEPLMRPDEALTISSCDYLLRFDTSTYRALLADPSVDVIVWTFRPGAVAKGDLKAFAYCRTQGSRVTEVVEKRLISDSPRNDPAVVGTFTYKAASDFVLGARTMIDKNIRVNGEFYVGTSINQLIELGKNVVCMEVSHFVSLGTPFELQLYQAWEELFFKEPSHPYTG